VEIPEIAGMIRVLVRLKRFQPSLTRALQVEEVPAFAGMT